MRQGPWAGKTVTRCARDQRNRPITIVPADFKQVDRAARDKTATARYKRRPPSSSTAPVPLAETPPRPPDCFEPWPNRAGPLAIDLQCLPIRQHRFLQPGRRGSRSLIPANALPRLFCAIAQSSGTRSRRYTCNAER
jgi:hypothetical protein